MNLKTFLSIDVETSGLSFENDRILQYGFSMFINGTCVETTTFDVCQEVENSAYLVNGISDDRILSGHSPYDIAMLLHMVLSKPPRRIVLYNAPFDITFISLEFARLGFSYDWNKIQIIDPLVIWRRFHPFQKGRLENVAAFYNIHNPAAHDAGADSATAGHIYCQMHSQYGILRNPYTNQLFKGWYDTWAEGFQRWAASKDIELSGEFCWPTRPELMCLESQPENLQLPLEL